MTLGVSRQPGANRSSETLGKNAWPPLKGKPTAKRLPRFAWRRTPNACQATLVDDGTPEARRALEGRAPALLQARSRGQGRARVSLQRRAAGAERIKPCLTANR